MSELVREGTGRNPASLAPESLLFMYAFLSCSPVFQHEEVSVGKGWTLLLKSYSGPDPTMETQQPFSKYFWGAVWGFLAFSYCSTCPMACGILVPRPGIEATAPALEGGFLTTGPPAEFLQVLFEICKLTLKHGNSQPLHLQKESNTE